MNNITQNIIKVCYLDNDTKFVSEHKVQLELKLKLIADINLVEITSLDDPKLNDANLIIICAIGILNFKNWFLYLHQQIINKGKIWIPGLIYTDISFNELEEMLLDFFNINWYFDILIKKEGLESLPIRISNLLKIQAHIKELHRYNEMILNLENKVQNLEKQLLQVKNHNI